MSKFFDNLKSTIDSVKLNAGAEGTFRKINGSETLIHGSNSEVRLKDLELSCDSQLKGLECYNLIIENSIVRGLSIENCKIHRLTLKNCTIECLHIDSSILSYCCITASEICDHLQIDNIHLRIQITDSNVSYTYGLCYDFSVTNSFIKEYSVKAQSQNSFHNSVVKKLTVNSNIYAYSSILELNRIYDWNHLLMNTGFYDINDDLKQKCMIYDAQHHPKPELFDAWAEGGLCPYNDTSVCRFIHFNEDRKLWKPEFKTTHVNVPKLVKELYLTKQTKLIFK